MGLDRGFFREGGEQHGNNVRIDISSSVCLIDRYQLPSFTRLFYHHRFFLRYFLYERRLPTFSTIRFLDRDIISAFLLIVLFASLTGRYYPSEENSSFQHQYGQLKKSAKATEMKAEQESGIWIKGGEKRESS